MFRARLLACRLGFPGSSLRSFSQSYQLDKIRNFGISAHIDSGKTTLTERILYYTGRIADIHEVRGKDGVGAHMDSMDLEREKGITIQSAATFTNWGDHHFNIVDTPGHVDFTVEVERALRILDGAILVVCSVGSVQSQTMTVDRQMKRYKVPRVTFINKLDRIGANPTKVVNDIRKKLHIAAAMVQYPIGLEDNHKGVLDLVNGKAVYCTGHRGAIVEEKEIPAEMMETYRKARKELIEVIADFDETIEELFLCDEEPTNEQLRDAIRSATLSTKFTPVFVGSAFKDKGVQPLLDGVVAYLPHPGDVENKATYMENDEEKSLVLESDIKGKLLALAFKLEKNKYGQLTYLRVYQGHLKRGISVLNVTTGESTKVPRLVRMHSNEMEDVMDAGAGEIVAMFGIDCHSGTSFTDAADPLKVSMENMYIPDPVMSISLKPKDNRQNDGFGKGLLRFTKEDPTFHVGYDAETNETIVSGMGELHLQIYRERLLREYNVETIPGKPTVRYRECLGKKAKFDYLHKKQTGGNGQYAGVKGYIEPVEDPDFDPNSKDKKAKKIDEDAEVDVEFVNNLVGENVPPQFVAAIYDGFKEACRKGSLIGHRVEGIRVVMEDGASHVVDSNDNAFRMAAIMAFRQAFKKGNGMILQPIMTIEATCPAEFQGSVMSTLTTRKANIINAETMDGFATITAEAPLANMFGYSSSIRGASEGKGEFSMEYKEHQPVSQMEQQRLEENYQKEIEEKNAAKR